MTLVERAKSVYGLFGPSFAFLPGGRACFKLTGVPSLVTELNRWRLWAGLIWLPVAFSLSASTNAVWFTRVWNTDEGLPNESINFVIQGRDNYLWVVPPVGLARFDGIRFSRFPIEDFTGSIDDHIYSALCDQQGVLWLSTYQGTVLGVKPDFSVVKIPQGSLPTGKLPTLAEDQAGALWMAYTSGIFRYWEGQLTRFGTNEGMPAGQFLALTSDGAGDLWLAKGNQICLFQNGRFQPVTDAPELQCVAPARANAIWLTAAGHLWNCDTHGAMRDCGAVESTPAGTSTLLEDHTGAVWIGTKGRGLIHYNQSRFEKIGSSYPSILDITEDREGNLWVATAGGGLDRISLSGVRTEVFQKNDTLDQIQSLCEDAHGEMWGATYDGALVSRVNGQWTPVFSGAPFTGTATCVAADRCGAVWIGTRNGGLLHVAQDKLTPWTSNAIPGNISALLPTANGDLWIVASQTLYCLRDGQLQEIELPRPVERFSAIAEDAAGTIWLAAMDTLWRFDGTNLVDVTPRLPISGRRVCCLYGMPDGSLLIGGGGLGLLRFKDGRVSQIGIEQGLFDDFISQIVADGRGWLWFGSDHGIFKIRQRELEQAMEDHNFHLHPIVYGRNEGLSSLAALFSTSTGSLFVFPRALCTRDDRVWLLLHTGLVVADPELLPDNYPPPPLVLTRVAVDGHTIASYGNVAPTQTIANLKTLSAPLRLPPGHRHLDFDFTAFHFSAPEDIHFHYQLAGFDSGWIDAGSQRSADYSRLTAGDYQFRVAARDGDGPWSEVPTELAFTVAPFFWQTWWFRLGVLGLFTAAVIGIVRYLSFRRLHRRLRTAEQQAAIERERGRIARDIHDDLGNRLTEIQLLTGLAQRHRTVPEKSIAHVQEIATTARQATDALDEIVWAINPHNDTLPHLIGYLGQFALEFLRTANIRCRVSLPERPPVKAVSAEVRHNLFLAIKESLNNIVRHARATEVFLLILATDESISVVIEDNGCGFNGESQGNGANGLANMRQRMAEIAGEFQIKSSPGTGTCVSFRGPWLVTK